VNTQNTRISANTAISLVVANMIGTGVFTSLGYQVLGIQSYFALLGLWIVGGLIALCGALCYGELAAAMPRSGGEYHYLSKIYHPSIGFLSGWVSATVGFAAPTALAAMALGKYASSVLPALNDQYLAVGVVISVAIIHSISIKAGSYFQMLFTSLKVVLIVFFIGAAFFITPSAQQQSVAWFPVVSADIDALFSPAFAVSLIYVSYAYSGWNAAVYMTGEIENPQKNLPRALLTGTALVTVLYVLLNYAFLKVAPLTALAGKPEVGYVAASFIFGSTGGNLMGLTIALLLISTVSAMVFAGPRVVQTMGEDLYALRFLAKKNERNIPLNGIWFQTILTVILIVTSSFEAVLTYSGFVLSLFTFFTVLGLFILRWKNPDLPRPYKTWGYPVTPIIFLSLTVWTLWFIFRDKTTESLYGLGTVLLGGLVYWFAIRGKEAKE
jgi:APA family basic amino acid/polyamine antiporter